jgi:hypothetical protein
MIIQMFQFYLGAVFDFDIVSHLNFFIESISIAESLVGKPPKTLLQEYFQSHQQPVLHTKPP